MAVTGCHSMALLPSNCLSLVLRTALSDRHFYLRCFWPIASPSFSRSVEAQSNRSFGTPPKCVYPDPIPEFAEAETSKFAKELLKKLSTERETFGNDLNPVVEVCSEILREFLQEEYGGPGTLMVEPFTNMLIALKDNKLPGAPMAARASLLWAQNNLDQDWKIWNSKPPK